MTSKVTRDEYLENFRGDIPEGRGRQREALKHALDIRKFEIDLYWKRAAQFWTFIAAAFVAYFALEERQPKAPAEAVYLVTCLGVVFSLAWYFVNRGSKFWQQNWEMHVDLLEEEVTGPLYKNILTSRPYRWWWPTDPFPFSVTKINHVLSLFTTVVWLSLWVRMFVTLLVGDVGKCVMTVTLTLITIATIVFLCLAQTKTPGPSEAWRAVRTYPKEGA